MTAASFTAVRNRAKSGAPFLGDVAALMNRRLLHRRRNPGTVLAIALNPLVMMIALGYLFKESIALPDGASYQEYVFAGVAAQIGLTSLGPTAAAVAEDLHGGLVDRFRSLSISRAAVLVAHTLSDLLVGILTLGLVTAVGLGVGWRPHRGLGPTAAGFAFVLGFILAMLWLGALLGSVLRSTETIQAISALLLVLLSFLSNALLSTDRMPAWLGTVAQWNPVSCVALVCRHLWGNPVAVSKGFPVAHPVAVATASVTVLLVLAVPAAVRAFGRADR